MHVHFWGINEPAGWKREAQITIPTFFRCMEIRMPRHIDTELPPSWPCYSPAESKARPAWDGTSSEELGLKNHT